MVTMSMGNKNGKHVDPVDCLNGEHMLVNAQVAEVAASETLKLYSSGCRHLGLAEFDWSTCLGSKYVETNTIPISLYIPCCSSSTKSGLLLTSPNSDVTHQIQLVIIFSGPCLAN